MTPDNKTFQQIGFWYALLTTTFAIIYQPIGCLLKSKTVAISMENQASFFG